MHGIMISTVCKFHFHSQGPCLGVTGRPLQSSSLKRLKICEHHTFVSINVLLQFCEGEMLLGEHIDVCGHGQFQVFPFYTLLSDNVIERREKEKYFIDIFNLSLKKKTDNAE